MKSIWHKKGGAFAQYIIAGDIGGTNSNLAVVGETDGKFTLLLEHVHPSQSIDGLLKPLQTLTEAAAGVLSDFQVARCCISAAGPVKDGVCVLSNLPWQIKAAPIAAQLNAPCALVNDFVAIGYGVPLLNLKDPEAVGVFQRSDGSSPEPHGPVRLVLGAGTGLGVCFASDTQAGFRVFASEGGQMSFGPFDKTTAELHAFLREQIPMPRLEDLISGKGTARIYNYLRQSSKYQGSSSEQIARIDALELEQQPKAIGEALKNGEPICIETLELFGKLYGKIAGELACAFLPEGGVFLAGGVTQRYADKLLSNANFIQNFERQTRPNIAATLQTLPIYLIREYSISLYGAAHAAVCLTR